MTSVLYGVKYSMTRAVHDMKAFPWSARTAARLVMAYYFKIPTGGACQEGLPSVVMAARILSFYAKLTRVPKHVPVIQTRYKWYVVTSGVETGCY